MTSRALYASLLKHNLPFNERQLRSTLRLQLHLPIRSAVQAVLKVVDGLSGAYIAGTRLCHHG